MFAIMSQKQQIMKSIITLFIVTIASLGLIFVSCKKNKDIDCPAGQIQQGEKCVEEQELITTLRITFSNGGNDTTFVYSDPDGIGGGSPVIDSILLSGGLVYDVTIQLWDESKNPNENLTSEVQQKGNEHQLFYTISTGLELFHFYNDQDANTKPIGITNTMNTAAASTGSLKITLKHQPNGSKDGNIATGETDVEVTFGVRIQ